MCVNQHRDEQNRRTMCRFLYAQESGNLNENKHQIKHFDFFIVYGTRSIDPFAVENINFIRYSKI